jgi:hypothetical protein
VGALAAQQFSRLAQSDYERITKELESLDRELSQIPDDYWTRYELPDSGSGARRVLDLLLSVNYRTEDLKKIRKSSSPVALSVPKKSLIPNEGFKMEDVEAFLSSTKVAYESDIEIKIQSPKKPQMVYSFKDLGFKNPQNKGWQVIIQLLQMGFFFVGTFVKGDKNAEYDRHQKRLDACEQKLKIFFRQEYGLKIPDSFKFFRLSHDERPGTYKPIFSIAKSDLDNFEIKCKQLSGEQIKTEINSLTHECVKDGISQAKINEIMPKLNILAAEAQRRGIVNYVTGRDNHEDNLDSEIGRDVPEDDREESSLE